ncbi:glycoside hydrolase family 140 protein [Novosphingobium flavum]|uniref:Glycoside hydrolase family 140 protein n=2 Tax=Novosphingobium flavum TaxID=1778672 RepID=A0A7X1FNY4_9SPHN|nr:glycoside hydrolase family 140 protein [Novosphingobium flavum]
MAGVIIAASILAASGAIARETPRLTVSANGRYLLAGGKPFFWQGDTAWLLLAKLNRDETERYLAAREAQGFNVIQVMMLHRPDMANPVAGPALENGDLARPRVTPGNDPAKPGEYDYWDHLDWVFDRAAAHGIYIALVPVWGDFADFRLFNPETAPIIGRFVAERYRNKPNLIWVNGGDRYGELSPLAWNRLGETIRASDPVHLMTYHPAGRASSSWAFHRAAWLDFNMYQSGHQDYAQDQQLHARGEDNWVYTADDLSRRPRKPTIDGEPSYENIPHGLDRAPEPRWTAADVRRYAWWSVMAGAFGHTYGENSVMQFFVRGTKANAYWPELSWQEALDAPGARQMHHLKDLILSRPFLDRIPDQSLITDSGPRYARVAASRGRSYAIAYTWTGRPFHVKMGKISGGRVRASWFDPRTGRFTPIGTFANRGVRRFTPPGRPSPGNDWALVLDDARGLK